MKNFLNLLLMSILSIVINQSFAQETKDIFKYQLGDYEVFLLSDGQQTGNSSILLDAAPQMQEKYIPQGTFSNAYNTFLIKAPGRNILIDAGVGAKLFENLKAIDLTPEQIDILLLTHLHGDHIGGMMKNGEKIFNRADIYISQPERDYWMSDEEMLKKPENQRDGFKQAQAVIKAYESQINYFNPNLTEEKTEILLPGFTPIAAYGHTPGHTMYMVESNDQKLLVWGDLTHAMAIQMPCPEVAVTYDTDKLQAVESRKRVLKYVSKNKIPVAGMHIAFPAIGSVKADGNGYVFEEAK